MPEYTDSKEPKFYVPPGRYILCATEYAVKYRQTGKTAGSQEFEVKMEIESQGCAINEYFILHSSTIWRVEAFIRAAGIVLKKGQGWSFIKNEGLDKGWQWIDLIGLRVHAQLIQDPQPNGRIYNKVSVYYSDKGFLPKRVMAEQAESPENAPSEEDIPF